MENEIRLCEKYTLNVQEAALYFGIGEKRIRRILQEHEGEDFILEIGSHKRIKRIMFEKFLERATVI